MWFVLIIIFLCNPAIAGDIHDLLGGGSNQPFQEYNKMKIENPAGIVQKSFEDLILQNSKIYTHSYPISTSVDSNSGCTEVLKTNLSLDQKLVSCNLIALKIQWQQPNGQYLAYPYWPDEKKLRLQHFLDLYRSNASALGLVCEVPNAAGNVGPYFAEGDAFDLYAAQVAHVFFVEENSLVSWSITSWPLGELAILLNSSSIFSPIIDRSSFGRMPDLQGYQSGRDYQFSPVWSSREHLCDPRKAYGFLSGRHNTQSRSLIAGTATQTLENISLWVASNLTHNYQGGYPVNSLFSSRFTSIRGANLTAPGGCVSASRILLETTRSLNIPLLHGLSILLPPDIYFQRVMAVTDLRGYLSMSHHGLIYEWTRDPKILVHTDQLYAEGDSPFWPIFRDPTRIDLPNDNEAAHIFFEALWLSPEQLRQRNFTLLSDFPRIIFGEGIGQYGSDQQGVYTFDSTLRFTGYYNTTPNLSLRSTCSNSFYHHSFSRKYELCSWDNFIQFFCENNTTDFYARIRSSSYYDDSSSLSYIPSPHDFLERASACIRLIGGCEEAANQARNWQRYGHFAGMTWRN